MRKGLGLGKGRGYYNIVPIDSHIHSLSAKGVKTAVLKRATYGVLNPKLARDKREYRLENTMFPVGTISEWKKFAKGEGIKKLEFKDYDDEFEVTVNAKGVVYSKPKMATEITKFIKKMKKKYGDDDDNFVVDIDETTETLSGNKIKSSRYIQLRTDGLVLTQLYNPSMSEMPYLIREANQEFGATFPVPTGYEDQEEFGKMLKKHGWDYEIYGQGIIEIYKGDW